MSSGPMPSSPVPNGQIAGGPVRDGGSIGRLLGAARHPPLWVRWLLSLAAFAILIAAIAIAIHAINANTNTPGSQRSEAAAEAEASREARIVIAEDQRPRGAALRSGTPAKPALERAIAHDAYRRTTDGQLTGPYESVRCRPTGSRHASRQAFACTVRSAHVEYPFAGVADMRTRELAWCKVDPPPEPGAPPEVPLSPRCRA